MRPYAKRQVVVNGKMERRFNSLVLQSISGWITSAQTAILTNAATPTAILPPASNAAPAATDCRVPRLHPI